MSNNLEEIKKEFEAQQVNQKKSKKNHILAYSLIGIGIAMSIFLVAEITGVIGSKQPEPEINAQASFESRLLEQQMAIEEAEKQKAVAELRKQATELELQALTIEYEDTTN